MPRVETFNRDLVLQNIMQVFWKKGYNGTSMQDLVNASNLNRSSLYNSFGDKMQLYKLALTTYMEGTGLQFEEVLNKSHNALETIRNIFYSFLPEIATDSRGCMGMNCKAEMASDSNIKVWLENTQEQTLTLFQKLVKDGQNQGVINKNQDCRTYAWHVFNAFQGFRMTGILEKDEKVLKSIIHNSLKILE
ncbi:MAG: TetR/AcrR family transcriptional regulator [Nonlabens sp.]